MVLTAPVSRPVFSRPAARRSNGGMKNRPLLILAIAAALIGWSFYKTMGGIEGMRRDPAEALFVGIFALLVMIPVFWFRYRKLERESPHIPVADPQPGAPADARLSSLAHVIAASRPKIAGLLAVLLVGAAGAAWAMWSQPGACRAVGLASFGPFILLGIAALVANLIRPERLEIAPWGLKHVTPWRTRQWPWEEVRDVTVIRSRTEGGSWTSGVYFNRYVSDSSAPGAARPTFRALWSVPADEMARLMNEARARWSQPGATWLVPARKGIADYLPLTLIGACVAVMMIILVMRPCG
jgi:hypothetical protein